LFFVFGSTYNFINECSRNKKKGRKTLDLIAAIRPDAEEDVFCAEVPGLGGCYSWGETFEDALQNITEAAELFIECSIEMLNNGELDSFPKKPSIADMEEEGEGGDYWLAALHNFLTIKTFLEIKPELENKTKQTYSPKDVTYFVDYIQSGSPEPSSYKKVSV